MVQSVITIREAMKALDKTAEKCLLVVDEDKKLLGTLSDGDLRRSILAGAPVSEDISKSFCTKPTTLIKNRFSIEEAKRLLRVKMLDLIPVIDKNRVVVDYVSRAVFGDEMSPKRLLSDVPVVIMAGGRGTRMDPFTKILPKPLVPVNEKPIIEHIIDSFMEIGCSNYYLTVNYKSKILKAYFEELQPNYQVNFINENKPLGTAGSLKFFTEKFDQPFFVTNCDIIIKANYASIYKFHQKGNYDLTLVASAKEYVIPYGTCELNDDGHLSQINEKPTYDFLVNTGLYVLNPDVLGLIPENRLYHITHLIKDCKKQEKKVGLYPVDDEAWIDVGEWSEYHKAVVNLKIK